MPSTDLIRAARRDALQISQPRPDAPLQALFASARAATGEVGTYGSDGTLRHVHKTRAASVSRYSINDLEMPTFAAEPFRAVQAGLPTGTQAGTRTTVADAVLRGGRGFQAGARLLVVPSAVEPAHASEGLVAWRRENMRFDCIAPAGFAVVDDGEDVPDGMLPIFRAAVDLETIPTMSFRVALSRADQRAYEEGQLADAALASITLGIARAADATLLAAITATGPEAFTLGQAAALGLEFGELRALVGTNGAGGHVAPDGTFRAAFTSTTSGVLAELTPATTGTVIGAFNRAAVAVHSDLALLAERTNVNGDLTLTAHVSMQALIPMPDAFWKVG